MIPEQLLILTVWSQARYLHWTWYDVVRFIVLGIYRIMLAADSKMHAMAVLYPVVRSAQIPDVLCLKSVKQMN